MAKFSKVISMNPPITRRFMSPYYKAVADRSCLKTDGVYPRSAVSLASDLIALVPPQARAREEDASLLEAVLGLGWHDHHRRDCLHAAARDARLGGAGLGPPPSTGLARPHIVGRAVEPTVGRRA